MFLPGDRWLVALAAGLFGLALGSFLNVCSLRWPRDESVVYPPSRCPVCGERIRWYHNIPVLGWIVLRGRCGSCGERISVQYPLAELATGLLWAGVFAVHGPSWEALRGGVFLSLLFGIALSDARFYIIPDQFSIGGTALGVGLSFLPGGPGWRTALVGAAVGYGSLWFVAKAGTWLIRTISPGRLEEAGVDQAMGGGDIKMMMMVGAFVGVWGVAETIFLGSVLALVVFGLVASLTKRLIPLGVFLAAAGAVTYVWGDALLAWYLYDIVGLPM